MHAWHCQCIIISFSVELYKPAKMSSTQSDCIEISTTFTEQVALAIGIPGVICLALSIVGLVAELLFVCKKKNNFLLRLYIYLSVAVLLVQATDSLYLIISVYPQNGWLCEIIEAFAFYPSMVEFFFIISIDCVLMHKIYTSVRTSCFHCNGFKAIEVIFVIVHFIIPLIIVGVLLAIPGDLIYWPYPGECHIANMNDADCNRRYKVKQWFKLTTEYIPVAIDIPLSILCICTLSIWCYWLLLKQLLRARMKTILKEIGLLLGFLSSYCIIRIVIEILNIFRHQNSVITIITYAFHPIYRVTIPFSFIIYVCFVYLCPPRMDLNTNPPTDQHTYPPSIRVSPPSNTVDRPLDILSYDEFPSSSPTETTSLLLN